MVRLGRFRAPGRRAHCDLLLASPPPTAGRRLQRNARHRSTTGGDARLLDALAGAPALVHTPADARVCLAIALVSAGARRRTTIVHTPSTIDDPVGQPARRVHDRPGTDRHVRTRQRRRRAASSFIPEQIDDSRGAAVGLRCGIAGKPVWLGVARPDPGLHALTGTFNRDNRVCLAQLSHCRHPWLSVAVVSAGSRADDRESQTARDRRAADGRLGVPRPVLRAQHPHLRTGCDSVVGTMAYGVRANQS